MSDLFCPATLILARHAEAAYTDGSGAHDAALTGTGREQARALARSLRGRKVAAVWCSDLPRAQQTAEILAGVLGVPMQVRPGLREATPGEAADDVAGRVRADLEEAVDEFRGETVLVVSHADAITMTLPGLGARLPGETAHQGLDYCDTCEIAVDADGWVLAAWAGQRVGHD